MLEDLGYEEPAAEGRKVTAAEPINLRLAPVAPQGVRVLWRNDLVTTASENQDAVLLTDRAGYLSA